MSKKFEVEAVVRDLKDRPEEERAFRDEEGLESGAFDDHVDLDDPVPPVESGALEAATTWRAAKALLALRDQVNAKAPNRNKASDGTIGDGPHCGKPNPTSDHCPRVLADGVRVVCAIDITHDTAKGCDAHAIAEAIRVSKDSRVKYIISKGRIANFKAIDGAPAFAWRPYKGSNPHNKHCHVSVRPEGSRFDDTSKWTIG